MTQLQSQLDSVFGSPDGPFQVPGGFKDALPVDPLAGGQVILDGAAKAWGFIWDFLMTQNGWVVLVGVVLIIIIFALPTNDGRPA